MKITGIPLLIISVVSVFSIKAQTENNSFTRLITTIFLSNLDPSGDKILYESNTSGNWEIYIMDTVGIEDGGRNITQLTQNNTSERMPAIK